MYKSFVFDLDGTLVDSPLDLAEVRRLLGIPRTEYILEYIARLSDGERQQKMQELEDCEVLAAREAKPFPGVLELLDRLQTQSINVGILTRNCRAATQAALAKCGLPIDMVVTREDAPAKPDPAGIHKFLHTWNRANHELLFVGDFKFDIECGRRASVGTALFTNGKELASDWGADHVFSHYSMFWECLSQQKRKRA